MLRLYASDPLYAEWDFILTMRAAFLNPGCFYDLQGMPEAERAAQVAQLDAEVVEMFEEMTR